MNAEAIQNNAKESSEQIECLSDKEELKTAPESEEPGLNQEMPSEYFLTSRFIGSVVASGFGFIGVRCSLMIS